MNFATVHNSLPATQGYAEIYVYVKILECTEVQLDILMSHTVFWWVTLAIQNTKIEYSYPAQCTTC